MSEQETVLFMERLCRDERVTQAHFAVATLGEKIGDRPPRETLEFFGRIGVEANQISTLMDDLVRWGHAPAREVGK